MNKIWSGRTARQLSWLLLALAACGPAHQPEPDLDLGGGIFMSAAGEVRGATGPWPPGLPAHDLFDPETPSTAPAPTAGEFENRK